MTVRPLSAHPQTDVTLDGAWKARMRMLLGPDDGASTFHMRHFEIAPGGHTPHHRHDYEHEIFVLRGVGLIRGEPEDRPCGAGDVVWIPANELHQIRNAGSEPLEVLCLIPAPHACTP